MKILTGRLSLLVIFTLTLHYVAGQYPNILIGTLHTPNEPSIVINPSNTMQMVAGSNIDNAYFSDDGGLTWGSCQMSSTYGVMGDPCIIADTSGNFYFLHLSNPFQGHWIDRIVCQKSTDAGLTWSAGTFMGLNGAKAQDKEWAVVDPATNIIYTTWTQFDLYGSNNPMDSSNIMFSRSLDGGQTWSPAKRINREAGNCVDSDSTVEGAVPAVGPNGEIYVAWAGPQGIVFSSSFDGGTTWPGTNIFVSTIPGGWDYHIPGIFRSNGMPVTCCDLSNGPYRGNIYINWSDQRNDTSDTDIWFKKSTDKGLTWSPLKRVNDDPPGHQQFFTWMTVDPVTGYIWIVFYDRREHSDWLTDVYMAVSKDGGETFDNFKVSESPFYPTAGVFFGDYTNVSACNSVIRPVWTRLDNNLLSIYTAIVDSLYIEIGKNPASILPLSLQQNFPNPVSRVTAIPFELNTSSSVTLKISDVFGRDRAILISNTYMDQGEHIEYMDVGSYNLTPGLYLLILDDGEHSVKKKMIIN